MRITTKLTASFLIVSAICGGVGLTGVLGLRSGAARVEQIGQVAMPKLDDLLVMKNAANEIKGAQRTLLDPDLTDEVFGRQFTLTRAALDTARAAIDDFTARPRTAEEAELWDQLVPLWDRWNAAGDRFLVLTRQAREMGLGNGRGLRADLNQAMVDHVKLKARVVDTVTNGTPLGKVLHAEDCFFGKWLGQFQTTNPQVRRLMAEVVAAHEQTHRAAEEIGALMAAGRKDDAEALMRTRWDPSIAVIYQKLDEMVAMAKEADAAYAAARAHVMGECRALQLEAFELLGRMVEMNKRDAEATVDAGLASAVTLQWTMAGAALGGIALAVGFGFAMSRVITRPIHGVVERIKDIAQGEGDLTRRIALQAQNCSSITNCGKKDCPAFGRKSQCWEEVGSDAPEGRRHCPKITSGAYKSCHECKVYARAVPDETAELSGWFNTFVCKVHDIIADVARTATQVAAASSQVAASSEELSSGMKQQAEQTTQVSAAVEQMGATVAEVSRKSEDASNAATEAGSRANEGARIVELTVEGIRSIATMVNDSAGAINELGKRGEQIGQVIGVISDIADQTNLLALNAAIEAARAGEHGRGFAVVADEVRKLAERTTKATDEVSESIRAIQSETTAAVQRMNTGTSKVEEGVKLAEEAGTSLRAIVGGSTKVAEMIGQIAAAAQQQAAASEQIGRSIETINAVARQSTQGVSEAAEAATSLSRKAEELQRMVGGFKLKQDKQAA